jgi:chromosome segregation ATPase
LLQPLPEGALAALARDLAALQGRVWAHEMRLSEHLAAPTYVDISDLREQVMHHVQTELGDQSMRLQDIQADMVNLKAAQAMAQQTLTGLQADVAELRSTQRTHDEKLETLLSRIENLEAQMRSWDSWSW